MAVSNTCAATTPQFKYLYDRMIDTVAIAKNSTKREYKKGEPEPNHMTNGQITTQTMIIQSHCKFDPKQQ